MDRLILEVEAAKAEAADNARHLKPLRKPLERFGLCDDFVQLPNTFQVERVSDRVPPFREHS